MVHQDRFCPEIGSIKSIVPSPSFGGQQKGLIVLRWSVKHFTVVGLSRFHVDKFTSELTSPTDENTLI